MKKTIALWIVFLFVMMSFTSISGIQIDKIIIIQSGRGDILYVGGSGPGNYSTIQDAIDNATSGDTIFVYDGSSPYQEPEIIIRKSINLIGEDKDNTVIVDNLISIVHGGDGVNISGFTFNNSSIFADYILSGIVISDNHFIGRDSGMDFYADDSFIISNTFKNCLMPIIIEGSNNRISDNIFMYNLEDWCAEGEIHCLDGSRLIITNNTFLNYDKEVYRVGIRLEYTDDCIIEDNEFNGYEDAIWLWGNARNHTISHNTFINNDNGILISPGSAFNMILNNNFINNSIDSASYFPYISKNVFDSNYWDEWIGLKIPILSFLPYFEFYFIGYIIDWHPAKEPYNYTTAQGWGIE
jgi:parallel beta-helix repeat protein